jgi:hypothetical protein
MKRYQVVILALFSLLFTSCSTKNNVQTDSGLFPDTKVILSPAKEINSKSLNNISVSQDTTTEYVRYFNSVSELSEESDVIFKGTVTDSSYFAYDGEIYTLETLNVDEPIRGNLETNQQVYMIHMKGIVTLYEYIYSYPEDERSTIREWYIDCTEDELKENYIKRNGIGDDVQGRIGQTSVFFIYSEDEYQSYLAEAIGQDASIVFSPIGDYMGEYREMIDGSYIQLSPIISVEQMNNVIQGRSQINTMKSAESENASESEAPLEDIFIDISVLEESKVDYDSMKEEIKSNEDK